MSSQYHIRIRGRVHGPFDTQKLRQLVRKGQFGRIHEISDDGHTWAPASSVPELFELDASERRVTRAVKAEEAAVTPSSEASLIDSNPVGGWFYSTGDGSEGPYSLDALKDLATQGEIGPEDKVWVPQKEEWVDASKIKHLAFNSQPSNRGMQRNIKYCHACSAELDHRAEICPSCGVRQHDGRASGGQNPPSRVTACLLALFLGGFGAQHFYLGRPAWGVTYLLLTLLLCWTIFVPLIIGLVSLIQGLTYLSYSDQAFAEKYGARQSYLE